MALQHHNMEKSLNILLIGDYSNVHATLAAGLRILGHRVVVASDGDGWKDYPRDIDLRRHTMSKLGSLSYVLRVERLIRRMRGFDIVQLIGPDFLPLKAERTLRYYNMLRRANRRLFLGAFGMDRYYVEACLDRQTFRYSDFNLGSQLRQSEENTHFIADWLHGAKGALNTRIANECDGIVAGLYEYHAAYQKHFAHKLCFIPFPIVPDTNPVAPSTSSSTQSRPLHFFIGLMRQRMAYKGTDVMLRALHRLQARYGDAILVEEVENLPFAIYRKRLLHSDVLLDQLYSYTPAMNALEAMSHGVVVVGGAEPENYAILGEEELRPIINVEPNEDSVYQALCQLVEQRDELPRLKHESQLYIAKHHDYRKVAQQYVDFWLSKA